MLNLEPWQTVIGAGLVTMIFSALGGFKGVVYTDLILFFVAMVGSIGAAYYLVNLPEIGGLNSLISNETISKKISIIPDLSDTNVLITLFIIPLAVQWWSSWYPGAEPGGGGYIAQRMLASKNENHAIAATFFFNIMHYALRPWPWILVALASLVIFPDLDSIKTAFPNITDDKIGNDLAYSAMLTLLPSGLLGLVLASLISAYMSTISTQLNWGSSYIVYDYYKQQINPNASEKKLVAVGRISTILLMVLSAILALLLQNALQLFNILLVFGAGTGLIFILRWFWWRINAWSEITAMFSSGIISILLKLTPLGPFLFNSENGLFEDYMEYPFVVIVTTSLWLIATFITKPESDKVLINFYSKIRPGGPGWNKVLIKSNISKEKKENKALKDGLYAMVIGSVLIYSIMFSTGYFLYGEMYLGLFFMSNSFVFGVLLFYKWKKIRTIFLS